MKTTSLVMFIFAVLLFSSSTNGQIKGTKAGSPEALEKIQKQRDDAAAQRAQAGTLNVSGMKVGDKGMPLQIDAKVMQVIDDKQMLVGIEDSRTGTGKYITIVMVKCSTSGITDGKFWRGASWKNVMGADVLEVTGTTTYKLAVGGTKTVFVIEAAKAPNVPVKNDDVKKPGPRNGATAYDDFIEPVRILLIQDWEREVLAIKNAIKEDEERAIKAKTPKERQHFEQLIQEYKLRLAKVEKNDPPYINIDSLKKK